MSICMLLQVSVHKNKCKLPKWRNSICDTLGRKWNSLHRMTGWELTYFFLWRKEFTYLNRDTNCKCHVAYLWLSWLSFVMPNSRYNVGIGTCKTGKKLHNEDQKWTTRICWTGHVWVWNFNSHLWKFWVSLLYCSWWYRYAANRIQGTDAFVLVSVSLLNLEWLYFLHWRCYNC